MEKITVDAYKLKRISSLMSKDFGTIPKGEEGEEPYFPVLFSMEHNLLKIYRKNSLCNDQRAIEAVQMSLLTIDGYLREIDYDFTRFANEENKSLMLGLLMAFDPFSNPEINKIIMKDNNTFNAKEYFKLPIMCLLRLEKSIQTWTESFGKNGYFEFIEGQIGRQVKSDDKMDFIIELKGKLIKKQARFS